MKASVAVAASILTAAYYMLRDPRGRPSRLARQRQAGAAAGAPHPGPRM